MTHKYQPSTNGLEHMHPAHMVCLQKEAHTLVTTEGRDVSLWRLQIPENENLLSAWAKYFRQHYCLDTEIDAMRAGTGLSRKDYLVDLIFPDKSKDWGPAVRTGDFSEILVADYLEFILGYWVPRKKYAEKAVRNESVKGVDILGFKLTDPNNSSPDDSLFAFEVKGQLSGKTYDNKLQDAINHSSKDYLRRAQTLNAIKRRLRVAKDWERSDIVERFQNKADYPYTYRSGAAAVLTDSVFEVADISISNTANHNNSARLDLLIIQGQDLMSLVHVLYERAADEA